MAKTLCKPEGETKTSYMFPSLHQDVSNAVSDEIGSTWFNEDSGDEDSSHEYSTYVIGKFRCDNDRCPRDGWSSRMVAILIRGYAGIGYNAVVFNQHCVSCNRLGILTLRKHSYVERVAYRLKKWAGVRMEAQHYDGKKGPPHKRELCEGCKQGYCQQTYD